MKSELGKLGKLDKLMKGYNTVAHGLKTRDQVVDAILESMCLDLAGELSTSTIVYIQNKVYGMGAELVVIDGEEYVSVPSQGLKLRTPEFIETMKHTVRNSPRKELLENYCLLTEKEWKWVRMREEDDCQDEWYLAGV